ncbi:histidinol dehydrogenase [Hirschia litorea]|uniref:Histidinol dehydrogenase n=1 Tax=Hirschia litorea TaxID=1199156 RepID=A0ABW2IHF1_9PROT
MARRFNLIQSPEDFESFKSFMKEPRGGGAMDVSVAQGIVDDVKMRGAKALVEYTAKFDRLKLEEETLTSQEVDLSELAKLCPENVKRAIEFAAKRIETYHAKQIPSDHRFVDDAGADMAWRWGAIDAVGLYVPGGRASYPSSVLMNAIPAKVAGVKRMVMVAPAPDGVLNPAVAYAALTVGISEYYPIGGAQAVAALAYGAGPLLPVDKIVGPGNAFVAAAKRIVFGDVGIDTIAGPSEITVVADKLNDPSWIAADLLSQCEHDPAAQSILITDDEGFASKVETAVKDQLMKLETQETATVSWNNHGGIVIAKMEQAASLVDLIAPEHVEFAVEEPEVLVESVRHAGAIFVGRYAPEALGDYVTGSNHVLPTSGAARFSSGLSALDFMKRTSIQRISVDAFNALAEAAETLAIAEGLPAHAKSVSIRNNN